MYPIENQLIKKHKKEATNSSINEIWSIYIPNHKLTPFVMPSDRKTSNVIQSNMSLP